MTDDIYVGNGILDQIKPPEPTMIQIEDLYKDLREDYWWILDSLLVDRPDLQERIKKYKRNKAS